MAAGSDMASRSNLESPRQFTWPTVQLTQPHRRRKALSTSISIVRCQTPLREVGIRTGPLAEGDPRKRGRDHTCCVSAAISDAMALPGTDLPVSDLASSSWTCHR